MDASTLKAVQKPLKDRYRTEPGAALVVLRASGTVDREAVACDVETSAGRARAGLHPATGGDGTLACSGDMLLQALAACAGTTLAAVATAMSIELREARVSAEGDLDFRGTLGVDREAPVGFRAIRLRFSITSDAPRESIAKLVELTERYCVVAQTIAKGVPIAVTID